MLYSMNNYGSFDDFNMTQDKKFKKSALNVAVEVLRRFCRHCAQTRSKTPYIQYQQRIQVKMLKKINYWLLWSLINSFILNFLILIYNLLSMKFNLKISMFVNS